MLILFQLGVWLLFLAGAVQCTERVFSDSGLVIKTYELDLQRGNEALSPCVLCKKVLQKIFKLIGHELSKGSIDMALNKVCEKELRFIKDLCMKFIRKYKTKLVKVIMSAGNAPDGCKHLGVCKKAKGSLFSRSF